MRGVGWHSQFMDPFPRSNADIRRIEVRTLLGELETSLFGALEFFVGEAFGSIRYQVACTGRRHVWIAQLSSDAGGPRDVHRIGRDPEPR